MNILSDIYNKKLTETDKNQLFWQDYLNNLTSLDFSAYSDKLRVPALVPIGSRILFRGELKHTNEVTVALGADYFAKCSLKQAEVLRQHRIKDAEYKVAMFKKEKEYLENQISFTKDKIYGTEGQEIIEPYTEDEDKEWRKKHMENMRRYKQEKGKEEVPEDTITDEELWNRLEELELQEELENELLVMKQDSNIQEGSFVVKEHDAINNHTIDELNAKNTNDLLANTGETESHRINEQGIIYIDNEQNTENNEKLKKVSLAPVQTPELELLQRVIDRQNELENKLLEMKNRKSSQSRFENDLLSKLEEMEELDDLEDEMDRLDDLLEIQDDKPSVNDTSKTQNTIVRKHVSFADQDDSETIEIAFKHTDVESDNTLYDPESGFLKPSDIYEAYASSFGEATSILKKTKCKTEIASVLEQTKKSVTVRPEPKDPEVKKTIIINDITERADNKEIKSESESRPTSLFKKKRMQNK